MSVAAVPAASPRRRRRHPAVRLTWWLLAGVAALVLLELVLRSSSWRPPAAFGEIPAAGLFVATADGDVALQAGWSGALGGDVATAVAVDGIGLRDREFAPKAAGERRLLVLGDAMVFGVGVPAEAVLSAQLQQALASHGEAWTVGNGGVPGYGSKHAALHLARLDDAFAADAFVHCGSLGDDALDDLQPERTVYAGLLLHGAWARNVRTSWRLRLACRSRLALWCETQLHDLQPTWSVLAAAPEPLVATAQRGLPTGRTFAGLFQDAGDDLVAFAPDAGPVLPRLCERLRESLRTMQARSGLRPFVFVVLPTRWQVQEQLRQDKLRELGFAVVDFPRGKAQQRWLAVADELGIPAFDATPILAGDDDPAGMFLGDGVHLSARGHAVLGRWLAERLVALLAR